MTIPCPACNKANPLEGGGECQRCRCDLTFLQTITIQSLNLLVESARELRNGNGTSAMTLASRSWTLRHSSHAAKLALLGAAASNNKTAALAWLKTTQETDASEEIASNEGGKKDILTGFTG